MQKLLEYHPQEGIVVLILLVLPSPLLENNSSCKPENTKLVEAGDQFTFVMRKMLRGAGAQVESQTERRKP
jgi:hypothetical protein